jgi:hypothetical protein
MAVHTAAVVDHHHLVTGEATPVFTAHIVMSVAFYPLYAAAVVGLIVAGIRDRSLGSAWIGWIGIIGAVAHGAAPFLVLVMNIPQAGILFPIYMLFAFWLLLAAVWPIRSQGPVATSEVPA